MDSDGYPEPSELERIVSWHHSDYHGLMEYVRGLWHLAEWGWRRKGDTYSISTGGWSGNESIIEAMEANYIWWHLHWLLSRRGGHYVFKPY